MSDDSKTDLTAAALHYHRAPRPGKLTVVASKPLTTQRDLMLAAAPGATLASAAIARDPSEAVGLTGRANQVAVISNGTAVAELGAVGALASKPGLEAKAMLFKKFADIDAIDLEIDETDPHRLAAIIASLEPSFGAICLADIGAPACFELEQALQARMKIPVFHDDQHGTAIVVGALLLNGLRVVGKDIGEITLVAAGAGVAALACLRLLIDLGLPPERITVVDRGGVLHAGRLEALEPWKRPFARDTEARTLAETLIGADVFLGLSAADVLTPEMVERMAERPLVLALAGPTPEILPEDVKAVRPDAVIATNEADYPNQASNLLCFPYLFRGALDAGASAINSAMQLACVHTLAELARTDPPPGLIGRHGDTPPRFGPDYLLPKPFDPRLLTRLAPAVARAAMASGVATRPIDDWREYGGRLKEIVHRAGLTLNPIFAQAKQGPKRLVYAEGEERRVLQAVDQVIAEGVAYPILVGRSAVIEERVRELGLSVRAGRDFEIINILDDEHFKVYWSAYHDIMGRRGISPESAKTVVRTRNTVVAALALRLGDADAMLCGAAGRFHDQVRDIVDIIGLRPGIRQLSTVSALVLPSGVFFICDTHIVADPSAAELVEMTLLAAEEVRSFGLTPKVALLSRSNFGTYDTAASLKMREAVALLHQCAPDLEVDGEMNADVALAAEIRQAALPSSRLHGRANLLIMPSVDAAHIAFNLLRMLGGGVAVGPLLLGAARPVHIVPHAITADGLLNMSAMAVVRARSLDDRRARS